MMFSDHPEKDTFIKLSGITAYRDGVLIRDYMVYVIDRLGQVLELYFETGEKNTYAVAVATNQTEENIKFDRDTPYFKIEHRTFFEFLLDHKFVPTRFYPYGIEFKKGDEQ